VIHVLRPTTQVSCHGADDVAMVIATPRHATTLSLISVVINAEEKCAHCQMPDANSQGWVLDLDPQIQYHLAVTAHRHQELILFTGQHCG
jgi:hypothetical protein